MLGRHARLKPARRQLAVGPAGFGRRAGLGGADYVRALSERPAVSENAVDEAAKLAVAPFEGPSNGDAPENPYTLQLDLQDTMNYAGRHHP